MNSIGSIWRKWDLHIHTPASFHWTGKRLQQQTNQEREETCKAIVEKMNSLDVDAFCIMDYWIFDGYLAVREYAERNPEALNKPLFPGIELRLEAPTDFRLNTHVLFDDAILPEHLQNFLARLNIGGASNKPPSRQNLIDLAKGFDAGKLRIHGYRNEDRTDDERMLELGLKTAVISRESLEEAMSVVGKEHCLMIQPYDTSDVLEHRDWKQHPCSDSYLMKMADMVFYLLLDPEEFPIIIDQPEQNLDNESVVKLLVDCIRQARSRRQVVIVTHNPNLAVVCDADQVISCKIDKANGNKVTYECGAIEDQAINLAGVNVLEGTYPAFDNRRKKYHKPLHT